MATKTIKIEVSELELGNIIKSLALRQKKKQKRADRWAHLKEVGLIIPVEVADRFIKCDGETAEVSRKLIEKLEQYEMSEV